MFNYKEIQVHAKDAKKIQRKEPLSKTNLFALLCEILCELCVNLHFASNPIPS